MTGANGGVTMTLQRGAEVWIFPEEDHKKAKIQTKDPDLIGVVPIESTDFLILCEQTRQKHIAEAEATHARVEQEIAASKAKAAAEEVAYGEHPDFCDYGFGKRIPEPVMAYLRSAAKDPSSIIIREIGMCEKEEHDGVKCWHIQFKFQGKNGFGGPAIGIVDAWLQGNRLLDLKVRQ